ncbi:zinc finger protein 277 [Pteronotus mesoamericanus]|uniref:zinc finger protein 277 n=1 Tax=Pteronotus mesoamericanus TaxID=1884717 RepID=UPI0023EA842E|nr:zinc finger protein 277 [Pteronotus parnellii mesoamericanus]
MAAPLTLGAATRGEEDDDCNRSGTGALSNEDRKDCILEPLSLPESPGGSAELAGSPSVPCIFCEEHFPAAEQDQLLKHMIIEHKMVIADIKLVADFQRYILYWRKRFTEQPITDFCSVIRINSTAPLEEQDNYFLLCDVLPEDRVLREELQKQKLKGILEQQQRERDDNSFRGVCMFCSEEFFGNRSVLLNHMSREHAFNIGLPDNIVNCSEFLHTLQKKLDNLQCLYCEKTFRDENTLKGHMRKRQHRRVNPKNREYDRFYVINYLELGKSWEEVQSEDDRELLDHQEEDWSDWEERPVSAVCLFCEKQAETIEKLCVHMEDAHDFDLLKIKSELGLSFYQQVKLVNFIRRQIHQRRCYGCHAEFATSAALRSHLGEAKHAALLPAAATWDQPEYYFPTYENDSLLCTLSDSDSDPAAPEQKGKVPVISEDTSRLQALRRSSVLNRLLLPEAAPGPRGLPRRAGPAPPSGDGGKGARRRGPQPRSSPRRSRR